MTNENRYCARKQTEYFDSTHLSTITLIIDIHDDRFNIKIKFAIIVENEREMNGIIEQEESDK